MRGVGFVDLVYVFRRHGYTEKLGDNGLSVLRISDIEDTPVRGPELQQILFAVRKVPEDLLDHVTDDLPLVKLTLEADADDAFLFEDGTQLGEVIVYVVDVEDLFELATWYTLLLFLAARHVECCCVGSVTCNNLSWLFCTLSTDNDRNSYIFFNRSLYLFSRNALKKTHCVRCCFLFISKKKLQKY